jgi:2,3-dihydroxybiphenyl 1,2-dioxygenase
MSIASLAYVGLGVSDVGAWARQAQEIFGLEDAGTDHGVTLLRMDEKAYRIALHADSRNDLIYAGYEATSAKDVADLAAALRDEGVRSMTQAESDARKVAAGIVVKDPDGLDIEIVHGSQNAKSAFKSPQSVSFLTGDQGIGHTVVSVRDAQRSLDFYQKLGFEISDYIDVKIAEATVRLTFLHCNPRHHTLALLPLPTPVRLSHLMLEVLDVDAVLRSYYRAMKNHVPIVRHMGRHTNDHMLSYYAKTSAGFEVEYGCDGRHISAGWKPETYNAPSIWGHDPSV